MNTRKVKVEVQGTTEIDWVSVVEFDVPESVLSSSDPEALSDWVDQNGDPEKIRKARVPVTTTNRSVSADLLA